MGFSGLSNVMQGLFASQEALRITSQNIQNASTDGYVRRVATFSSTTPTGNAGVSVKGEVMRDNYLDSKVWNETSISTEWETKSNYYDRIMGIIDEPTDYSISEVTNDFFKAFESLANEPSNISYRVSTIDAAQQFTNLLNNMAAQLENLQGEINEDIYTYVSVVNGITEEIADLNNKIYQTEIAGRDASFLKDTLNNKIQELSKYGDVTVEEVYSGRLSNGAEDRKTVVTFGGFVVVSHNKTTELKCVKRENKINEEDIEGLYDIELETGSRLDFRSGKLKGLLELRDGTGASDSSWVKGIVYYTKELNDFACTFAKAFNEGMVDYNRNGDLDADEHTKGFADMYTFNSEKDWILDADGNKVLDADGNPTYNKDADGNPLYKKTGLRFFTTNNESSREFVSDLLADPDNDELTGLNPEDVNDLYTKVTAKNISISCDILDNVENMPASFTNAEYENDVQAILDLISFREDPNMFNSGDIDGFIEGMVTSIGLDAAKSISLSDLHTTLLEDSENSRASFSDVSLDEEATFAVQFQYMYKACANIVNIYSELYDALLGAI